LYIAPATLMVPLAWSPRSTALLSNI
jgi:hypothetical protein